MKRNILHKRDFFSVIRKYLVTSFFAGKIGGLY